MENKKLLVVLAPYYTAGIVFQQRNGELVAVDAAPIVRWTKGKTFKEIETAFKKSKINPILEWAE